MLGTDQCYRLTNEGFQFANDEKLLIFKKKLNTTNNNIAECKKKLTCRVF